MAWNVGNRRRIGDVLLEWGSISPEDLQRALELQSQDPNRPRLGTVLVNSHLIDERTLTAALAELHGLSMVDLDTVEIDPDVGRSLDRGIAERYQVIPISMSGGQTMVAVADPFDMFAADDLRARLPGQVSLVVATPSQIARELKAIWGGAVNTNVVDSFVEHLSQERPGTPSQSATLPDEMQEDDGAVGIVNQIITAAAGSRASDIHIEPMPNSVRVRIRVDGMMQEMLKLPRASLAPIVSRVKVLAGLDVFQRRGPQDGRARIELGGQRMDLRVSTLPAMHGENVVMRLLPSVQTLPKLSQMGLTWEQIDTVSSEMAKPQGFTIVTGPTGSGKSTTIYSMLSEFIGDERNTITVEDPVEMEMAGFTQVQIDDVSGVTFPAALRAALRQDPDVVVVGEIRDAETAQMAVSAALTGHLVLSTLHTLDAPSAVNRLVYIGLPAYLVAESLRLVIAQRLLRRPCGFCSQPAVPDLRTQELLQLTPDQAQHLISGVGCSMCSRTGYLGRVGVYEMLHINHDVRQAIMEGQSVDEISAVAAKSGFVPLRDSATQLAIQGLTTAEEILRTIVTGE